MPCMNRSNYAFPTSFRSRQVGFDSRLQDHEALLVAASVAAAIAIGVAAIAVYAGIYNIAADAPHSNQFIGC
jgi:hypothetical protein